MTSPSTHADHDSAIVFMTYQTGQEVMERFRTLLAQAGGMSACYLLLDAATPGIEHAWRSFMRDNAMEGATLVTFLAKDVAADLSVPLFTPDRLIPGSAHLPLTWLARKLGHKHFWFVEDAVVYTGDWADFFRLFTADTADLLCSHHYSFTDFPRWAW